MAPTYSPTGPPPKDESFPTAAIVVIAIGGYLILFTIGLIMRKCIISKNEGCPAWCIGICECGACCQNNTEEPGCATKCAEACDWKLPSKQKCMDSCCPTKQWCDDTFCFCFSKQPQGQCCKCDDCSCGECGDCCECPECNECCDDFKCECCAQPETIDCCCIEVKLAGSNNRNPQQSINQGGYMNQGGYNTPGGYMNQSSYPGGSINQQPGLMHQMSMMSQQGGGFSPGISSQFQSGQFDQSSQYHQSRNFQPEQNRQFQPTSSGMFQPQQSGTFYGGQTNQHGVGFSQPSSIRRSGSMQQNYDRQPSFQASPGNMPGSNAGGGMFQARPAHGV